MKPARGIPIPSHACQLYEKTRRRHLRMDKMDHWLIWAALFFHSSALKSAQRPTSNEAAHVYMGVRMGVRGTVLAGCLEQRRSKQLSNNQPGNVAWI